MNKVIHPRLSESWRLNRRKKLYKTQKRCHWCKVEFDEPIDYTEGRGYPRWIAGQNYPTIEHIVPLSEGGTNSNPNTTLACLACNSGRNN